MSSHIVFKPLAVSSVSCLFPVFFPSFCGLFFPFLCHQNLGKVKNPWYTVVCSATVICFFLERPLVEGRQQKHHITKRHLVQFCMGTTCLVHPNTLFLCFLANCFLPSLKSALSPLFGFWFIIVFTSLLLLFLGRNVRFCFR